MAAIFWSCLAVVFYAYVLFPLILAAAARWFGRPAEPQAAVDDEELPRVAMVVSAYNEAGTLRQKLANTWQLDYPPERFRLLIGSDGSDDGTDRVLRETGDPRLEAVLFSERRGKISVLNDLVRRTDAEILIMSDANTMFAPDSIRHLVRHFRDPAVGCVSGELCLDRDGGGSGEGIYWKYEGWIKRNESRLGFLIGCNGGIFALRRELYDPLPPTTVVEDFVLTLRVLRRGYAVRFEPAARAVEPPCPTMRAEMVRKIRIGAGGFQALGLTYDLLHPRKGLIAFAYWGHKVLRWLAPLFLLGALGSSAALAHTGLYRTLLGLQIGAGLIAAVAYWTRPGTQLPRWTRPVSYFYLMNFALLCGLIRFLSHRQPVTWDRTPRC